jgi:CRP-like cAMP-binding protein
MQIELPKAPFSMDLLARRLAAVSPLSERERALLLNWQPHSKCHPAGSEISGTPDQPARPRLIVSGWACRERILPNGRRQLLSILLPGDLIGGCTSQRALDLVEVVAISNVRAINVAGLLRVVEEHPEEYSGIARGISLLRFCEERRLIDHMIRLGSQPALQRVAGFLLELFQRCRAIGYVSAGSFVMPLTQEMLGNALGLSVVHVNRVMRQLKLNNLIDLHGGIIKILDVRGLGRIAEMPGSEPVREHEYEFERCEGTLPALG